MIFYTIKMPHFGNAKNSTGKAEFHFGKQIVGVALWFSDNFCVLESAF